jgi:hypothetical protein
MPGEGSEGVEGFRGCDKEGERGVHDESGVTR